MGVRDTAVVHSGDKIITNLILQHTQLPNSPESHCNNHHYKVPHSLKEIFVISGVGKLSLNIKLIPGGEHTLYKCFFHFWIYLAM